MTRVWQLTRLICCGSLLGASLLGCTASTSRGNAPPEVRPAVAVEPPVFAKVADLPVGVDDEGTAVIPSRLEADALRRRRDELSKTLEENRSSYGRRYSAPTYRYALVGGEALLAAAPTSYGSLTRSHGGDAMSLDDPRDSIVVFRASDLEPVFSLPGIAAIDVAGNTVATLADRTDGKWLRVFDARSGRSRALDLSDDLDFRPAHVQRLQFVGPNALTIGTRNHSVPTWTINVRLMSVLTTPAQSWEGSIWPIEHLLDGRFAIARIPDDGVLAWTIGEPTSRVRRTFLTAAGVDDLIVASNGRLVVAAGDRGTYGHLVTAAGPLGEWTRVAHDVIRYGACEYEGAPRIEAVLEGGSLVVAVDTRLTLSRYRVEGTGQIKRIDRYTHCNGTRRTAAPVLRADQPAGSAHRTVFGVRSDTGGWQLVFGASNLPIGEDKPDWVRCLHERCITATRSYRDGQSTATLRAFDLTARHQIDEVTVIEGSPSCNEPSVALSPQGDVAVIYNRRSFRGRAFGVGEEGVWRLGTGEIAWHSLLDDERDEWSREAVPLCDSPEINIRVPGKLQTFWRSGSVTSVTPPGEKRPTE